MCKKHATDVYEMRKDINEIRTRLELHPSDIGEPPVFEDPFAAYDADVAAWYAAQESGAAQEEAQEEAEISPAQPRHSSRCPHGKDPMEEEEIQEEEETEEEADPAYVSHDDDDDDDGSTSGDDGGDGDYEDDE